MPSKKCTVLKLTHFLFKDRTLLCAHAVFYAFMVITYRIDVGFNYDNYDNNLDNFIAIFFYATILVEVILFFSMLMKLFTKSKTHQLTSNLGLFIGVSICVFWFGILLAYFAFTATIIEPWRENNQIGFTLISLFPWVSSACGYILLIFIKAIRSFICQLCKNQNCTSTQ